MYRRNRTPAAVAATLTRTDRGPGLFRFLVVATALVMVALLLGARPAAAQPGPDEVAAARAGLPAAREAGDWDQALEYAEIIAFQAMSDHIEARQEVVRLQCAKGDTAAAFAALDELLEAGCWNFRALSQDEGLALITGTDRYRAAVRGAWAKQYIGMLERDSRAAMQFPDRIMENLAFRAGERVADIGAGSGYFTVPVAHAVAPQGKVWALDIRQEMLDYIANRLPGEGLENVELAQVAPDDPALPAGGVDTILMVDVFHYIKERTAYAEKLRAGLAPGGRLVVIDFRYDPEAEREFAPPPSQQIPRDVLDADLAAAGFSVREAYDFLPEQYFVVYEVK